MKTLGVGGTVFAFGAGAGYAQQSGQSGTENGSSPFPPSENTALVRAIHASPDAPAVDVYIDGQQVAQGVQFGNITGYLDLSPGEVQVQVYPSQDGGQGGNQTTTGGALGNETGASNQTNATGTGLSNETNATGTGNETNVTGTGNETNATGLSNETNATGLSNETNATGLSNETNATGLSNETNATGLSNETNAGSASQTPSTEPLLDESFSVEGGQSYTIAAAGRSQDIKALVFEDTPEGEQTQDEQDANTDTALVRAVNLSPDAGVLKVRASSYVVGGAIESEEASNYATIQAGNTQVEVLQTGSADPIATANYQFEAGERYNLFLVGMVDPESAAQAQGGLVNQSSTGNETAVGNETGVMNETGVNATNETGINATNETGINATNETGINATNATNETGVNATNETGVNATNETGVNATNETGVNATNETGVNATNETGVNATNETGVNATNETGVNATNETTVGNETAVGNETTGTQAQGAGSQTQVAEFQIVGVQDSDGTILKESEQQTPSADDLLPIDLSGGNDTAQNGTSQNATATNDTATNDTATNDTAANATAENGTTTNGTTENSTLTNGTATETGNTTTSS
ncbi:DUF4397 domain-containing protein [Halopelagius fulvigenes]|uniref:DUF4397 domain-containing protein n=1 Tax=Halopelagius fulvigenes TaxID=1198324 RepID=A0ABD5TU12_9EURY